ncbi:hypothetical protein [Nonomuraea guangzhouensis]|uniref:Lipoprotein n=1 Tax=Nonomuraea guangzhouensis TaxID=1291555 RepID=A0ABW4GIG4_9ACTN|nr:hypothetical protein [Nonomuraea guangzhouensis]
MKRIIAGLALASAATLITAGPALAAPAAKDPVAAVKKQFVAGKGVKFSETTKAIQGPMRGIVIRRSGSYQFSNTGVAASDITGKFNVKGLPAESVDADSDEAKFLKALSTPERTIRVGKTSYMSGGIWGEVLPEGKTWFKVPNAPFSGLTGVYGQPLDLTEAATLKTLFKGAKAANGGYAGKITVGDLRRVSPTFRGNLLLGTPSSKTAKVAISWKLTVDAKGLPSRLVTTFPMTALSSSASKKESLSIETVYSGWGSAVKITAPPADQVTDTPKSGTEDETIPSLDIPFSRIVK